MAVGTQDRLAEILDSVVRAIGRAGVKAGDAAAAKGTLRVTAEANVMRTVRVYWTPFQINIPGDVIGLHLEVAEPKVHWCEAYLSPTKRNWVLAFRERADGEVELAYYQEYATPEEALEGFFAISGWYVLTATDKSWVDVVYEVGEGLDWPEHYATIAGDATPAAIAESLKKSDIFWLRWKDRSGEVRTMPVWFLYDQKADKIYVLSGERQQTIPDAESLRDVEVVLRWKGKNSAVAEIPAVVSVIRGDDPRWTEVADKIAEKRLNIPGLPEDTAERWRDECVILDLKLRP